MELDKYAPQDGWYIHKSWSGVHAEGHAGRVLIWADQIGRWMQTQGIPLDLEVVRWAAVFHDVRRENDGWDSQHGERAAIWLKEQAAQLPCAFNENQLECCCYCCRWHVPGDAAAPAMTTELTCLKDADGLDRVRIGDLNIGYLRTPFAKRLAGQAKELFLLSYHKRRLGQWEAVREAAIEMKLWH